jgi:hypothetical protein
MSDPSIILKALTGSATAGQYPDTLHDRLDAALAEAWVESTGLDIATTASGGDPGPFRSNGTDVWSDVMDQLTARYGTSPKARTLAEKLTLLDELVTGIDAAKGTTTGTGTGTTTGTGTGTTTGGTGTTTPPAGLPAGTSQGSLTWGADFTKGDVVSAGFQSTDWNTQSGPTWPPPIVAAPDNGERCIRFALPSGGERIEVQPNAAQSIGNGQDVWYGFWFIADSSFVSNIDDWHIICQFHGNDTTSPHQIIAINGGDLITGNAPQHHFANGQIKAGVRYNLVTHITANSGGHQSVWLNDVLVLDDFAAGLNATPLYLKCGIYESPGEFPASTIYQGQHRVGTGYGAVRPLA